MITKDLKVICYSGHTYAERPESFIRQGNKYNIREIQREWREPGKKYFQVRTENNKIFRLCYNETNDRWSISGEEER